MSVVTGISSSTLPAPTSSVATSAQTSPATGSCATLMLTSSLRQLRAPRWRATARHMPTGRAPPTPFCLASCPPRGRIHGEFLRLLYILSHRRTDKYFADMGDREPGTDAFTWRRSQYFWKHKAAIGFSNAVSVARGAHLAHPPHTSSPVASSVSSHFGYLCRHPFFHAFSLAALHLLVYT